MFRKIIKIATLMLVAVFVIATVAFTSREYRNAMCRNIEFDYAQEDVIRIDKNELLRLIKDADPELTNKKLNQVNAETLELAVKKHDAVLEAEVYKVVTLNDSLEFEGVTGVRIKHRKPIVRVISNNDNYYLDEYGGRIPTSQNYVANVLVLTGSATQKHVTSKVLPFILYMENDEFWKAQIEQVHVEDNGELVLIPLVGDHIIQLGKPDNYTEKLRNMKSFYETVLTNGNWNKYKSINLKYKNQVVAKRR